VTTMTSPEINRAEPFAPSEPVEMIRHAEQLRAGVEWVAAQRVRVSKRIVTETRTITVELRREELVVERTFDTSGLAGDSTAGSEPGGADGAPFLELVLHEEVPEVSVGVVAVERVRIFKDTVSGTTLVQADLRREEIEVVDVPSAASEVDQRRP